MITWKYTGDYVMAKMSHSYEFLVMQLKRITRHEKVVIRISPGNEITVPIRVNRLTFIDKTGTEYNTYLDQVNFILPEQTIPTCNIYKLMEIEEGDYVDET